MNRQKIAIWCVIVGAFTLLAGMLIGIFMQRSAITTRYIPFTRGDKLTWTMSLLENKYVDTLAHDTLVEKMIPLVLSTLDPHSIYIPKEDFAEANEPLTGHFDGIGVVFNMMSDTVSIINVIAGGPSDKVGIIPGDRIITVNDSIIAGRKIDQNAVVKMLRGERGTKVNLGIERNHAPELIPITVTRGVIPMKSMEAALMIEGDIGFIKFSRFASTTYKEVSEALQLLTGQGAKKIILDLRGNSGGYLDQAIYIANEFLPAGKMIVYTEGIHSPRNDQFADGRGRFQDIPLTILIDEGSASASEIVAGAIQDNDRGIIVGRRSFGKGLVQEQFPYSDGSAARITVARYYTPIGRSIQKPYTVGDATSYNMELTARVEHQELFNADSIKQNESERFVTPSGKIVYGGGGIMPDIFVPYDTVTFNTAFYRRLVSKNMIIKYANSFTDTNREKINSIKTFDELNKFFAGRNMYGELVAYARKNGVEPDPADAERDRSVIVPLLKGYIGRNTNLEDNAFYYYFYPLDQEILRSIETFLVQ